MVAQPIQMLNITHRLPPATASSLNTPIRQSAKTAPVTLMLTCRPENRTDVGLAAANGPNVD
jgi:hypothetical protein